MYMIFLKKMYNQNMSVYMLCLEPHACLPATQECGCNSGRHLNEGLGLGLRVEPLERLVIKFLAHPCSKSFSLTHTNASARTHTHTRHYIPLSIVLSMYVYMTVCMGMCMCAPHWHVSVCVMHARACIVREYGMA